MEKRAEKRAEAIRQQSEHTASSHKASTRLMQQLTAQERVALACVECGRRLRRRARNTIDDQVWRRRDGRAIDAVTGAVTGGYSLKHALAERGLVHLSAARVGRKLLDGRLVRLGLTVRVRSEHVIVE